jgi:hypothetical protein
MTDTQHQFDLLLEKYLKDAAGIVNGKVIDQINYPFDSRLMDAAFGLSTTATTAIKDFVKKRQPDNEIASLVLFTAFSTNFDRKNTKMDTKTVLYLVQRDDGRMSVLLFMGCSIDDP